MVKIFIVLTFGLCFHFAGAQAKAPAKAASTGVTVDAGKRVFAERCMQCHSVNENQTLLGPSLWGEMTKSPHRKTVSQVRVFIRDGKGKMPPWKDILSEAEIKNLIAYLQTL